MTFLFQWGHATWKKFVTTLLKELSYGCWLCRPKPYRVKGGGQSVLEPREAPRGWAMLGVSVALGHPPERQDLSEPLWGSTSWWSSPRNPGARRHSLTRRCPLLPQGRGLHPLRDGHREAPLPRLHGQGGAAPHLPTPRSVSCAPPVQPPGDARTPSSLGA